MQIDSVVIPAKLATNPVLLLVAGFDAISFGFWVALNALMPVWLQKPVKAGGYGVSVLDNAACKHYPPPPPSSSFADVEQSPPFTG